MANTTSFTIEGPMTLAYYANERYSKRVLINPKEEDAMEGVEAPVTSFDNDSKSLESKIADTVGFPNDTEFDEVFKKLEELRKRGLRTEEGVPDGTREVQLRIIVEVL